MELRLLLWLRANSDSGMPWFSLAFTYLLHSIVWASAVTLLVQIRVLSSATRHLYWKVALIGPLFTALVAFAIDAGAWHTRGPAYVRSVAVPSFTMPSGSEPSSVSKPAAQASEAAPGLVAALGVRAQVVVQVGLASAGVGLLRFVASLLLFRHRLRHRTRVTDGRLLERLQRLCTKMSLRTVFLSESPSIASPLVIGRHEICIPSAVFADLSQAELDTVFAHELAHVERADGLWFPIAGAVQSVLWLHPLNHLLAFYFRDSAELACDDRAVELTHDPLCLARALVQVAASASFARRSALVPAMLRSRSALLLRVRRLTCGSAAKDVQARECGRIQAIAPLTLLGCLLGALSVQVAQAQPRQSKTRPKMQWAPVVDTLAPLPPDAAEASARMAELATREQRLLAQLATVPSHPQAASESSAASVRVLELELSQELRHVRATQTWLEARIVSDWAAFEKKTAPPSASR